MRESRAKSGLERRVDRIRRMQRGVVELADEACEQLFILFAAVGSMLAKAASSISSLYRDSSAPHRLQSGRRAVAGVYQALRLRIEQWISAHGRIQRWLARDGHLRRWLSNDGRARRWLAKDGHVWQSFATDGPVWRRMAKIGNVKRRFTNDDRVPPTVRRIRYLYRWVDVHHRLYTSRARRYLRGYLVVLIDPDVPVGRRTLHGAKGVGVMSAAAFVALVAYMILLVPLTPARDTIRQVGVQHPAVVVDARGEVITRYRRVNREWVDLETVSPHFLNALLTAEDRRFFHHDGIDLRRIFGAGVKTATGDLQGGSTITQQLARNLFPNEIGRRVTIRRKMREIVTALKIEAVYSKAEILESYINTVPFLYNAVGIETAARTYFGKSASDLTVLESATLVGMLKGTFYYNPVRNPERAIERRNIILGQMHRIGALTSDEFDELKDEPLGVRFEVQPIRDSRAPHFTQYVRRQLVSWADRNGYNIYTDSLVVHTTLDLRMQRLAEEAVANQTEALQAVADVEWAEPGLHLYSTNSHAYLDTRRRVEPFKHFWNTRDSLVHSYIRRTTEYEALIGNGIEDLAAVDSLREDRRFIDSLRAERTRLEASFVAIDPRTAHVKAWVGSRDFERDEFDHVAQARRQAGSTFKPFLYAAALEQGYTPGDIFVDRPVAIQLSGGRVWSPGNAGDITGRRMTMREGLSQSVNTISAQLVERVGAENVADLARRAGIRSELDVVPSIALGTSSVTLKEMVTAYATLANGGIYREPPVILRIEDRHGNVLFEADPEVRDVIPESVTEPLVDMMRGVIDRGTGRRVRFAYDVRTDVAGKTGTTEDGADGWFILMHPDLVAGSWVGFNDRRITFRSDYWGQGAHTALPIVGQFFRYALRDESLGLERRPPPPPEVRYVRVSRGGVSGWLRDVFDGPRYRRVVTEQARPKSDMGRRIPEDGQQAAAY